MLLNIPHQRQNRQADCLAACAAMVLRHLQVSISYNRLLHILKVDDIGTPFRNLEALRSLGVSVALGAGSIDLLRLHLQEGAPPIVAVNTGELRSYWAEQTRHALVVIGIEIGGYFRLNPRVDDIPDRLSAEHGGVKLLQLGTIKHGGAGCICPKSALLNNLVTHLLVARNEVVILDMEAGIEHLGRGTAKSVDAFVIVVEPIRRSMDIGLRIHQLALDIGVPRFCLVGNKVRNDEERAFIQEHSDGIPIAGFFPVDERVSVADREGVAVFDAVPELLAKAQEIAQFIERAAA